HNDLRVADAITDGRGDWVTIGETKKHVSTYLKDFLFSAEQWRAPVAALSGGERGRLALAAALAKPSNMLVLDEPTNDLDLETLELLEEMLAEYDGALLLVSHDRNFINRTVTSILTTDPVSPGKWRLYPGGYDDMVAQRGAAPGAAVTRPPPGKTDAENKNPPSPRKSDEPTKLSYKDKFALEQLPTEMAALEDTIKKARDTLSDPALFETDPDAFHKTAAAMEAAQTRLAAAEEEWLALEMKREAMEERAKS
ncbi:MAG: ATP-binding cassette domain-containing protein, partial [Pseudomonadota bacterium]